MDLNDVKVAVKCPKCKRIFYTRSKLGLISCNSCGNKFKRGQGRF